MPKHAKVKVYKKYDENGTLKGEKCPRCGGILANHNNRVTCGKCGYSSIKKNAVPQQNKPQLPKEEKVEETPKKEVKEAPKKESGNKTNENSEEEKEN